MACPAITKRLAIDGGKKLKADLNRPFGVITTIRPSVLYTEAVSHADWRDIGALTWKERRLEVFGGGLWRRVEAL